MWVGLVGIFYLWVYARIVRAYESIGCIPMLFVDDDFADGTEFVTECVLAIFAFYHR